MKKLRQIDGFAVNKMRMLLLHCPERWPLVMFWDSASQDNDIGRSQGVTAAFNGMLRQLGKSGALSSSKLQIY